MINEQINRKYGDIVSNQEKTKIESKFNQFNNTPPKSIHCNHQDTTTYLKVSWFTIYNSHEIPFCINAKTSPPNVAGNPMLVLPKRKMEE